MASANNLGTAYIRIAPQMDGIQSSISRKLAGLGSESGTSFSNGFSLKAAGLVGTVAGLAAKAADTAMTAIKNSIDGAIKRVDTLNTFPKIMKNLGFETEESSSAVQKLSDRIEGLPTTLDEIVSYTQRLASTTGNLNEGMYNATNLAIAFNDAALAGGKGQFEANRAFEQFTQVISRGRPSMQDWKIMMEVMPGQLKQLAKYMGQNNESLQDYAKAAKKTVDQLDGMDLYEWISENKNENAKARLGELQKALIDLDNKGGAGITSFKDQVGDATHTIGTAMRLIPVRITKALAQVISAFDTKKIYTLIDQFSSSFKRVGDWIVKYVVPPIKQYLIPALKSLIGMVGKIANFIATNDALSKSLVGLFTAIVAFKTIGSVASLVKSFGTAILAMAGNLATGITTMKAAYGAGMTLSSSFGAAATATTGMTAKMAGLGQAITNTTPVLGTWATGLGIATIAVGALVAAGMGLYLSIENQKLAHREADRIARQYTETIVSEANAQRDLNKAIEIHEQILDDIATKQALAEDAEYQLLQAKQQVKDLQAEYNEMLSSGTASADQLRMKELELNAAIRQRDEAEQSLKTANEDLATSEQQRIDNLATELLNENKLIGATMLQNQEYGALAAQMDALGQSTIQYMDEQGNLITETQEGSKEFADSLAYMLRTNDATWKQIVDIAQSEGISYVEAAKRVGSEAGKGLPQNFSAGVQSNYSLVTRAASGVMSEARSVFDKESGQFVTVGANVVQGIASGVLSRKGPLIGNIQAMMRDLAQAARDAAQIKSPSRVFAEIGKFMDLGLVKGLNDYEDEVQKAAESVADTAISAVDRDASMGLNLNSNGRLPRPSSFFDSSEPTQVVQNNVFNQVSDELDLKAISRQLGWEVATVI